MRNLLILSLLSIILCLSACTKIIPYYKPDIQQGNELTQTQLNGLKPGMSKAEVINLLGTPVVQNGFYDNQLIYVDTNQPGNKAMTGKRLVLEFSHDKLVKATGDYQVPRGLQ